MLRMASWFALGIAAGFPLLALGQSKVVTEATLDLGNRYVPEAATAEQFLERRIRLPFSTQATTILVEKVGTRYFYQGDIIVDEDGFEVIAVGAEDQDDRWRNGTIPIAFAPDVAADPVVAEALYDALNALMLHTELQFVPRDRQRDYVEVVFGQGVRGAAASSRVGRVGGRQELVIHIREPSAGVLMHELLHAAGLYHEQSRPDRDNFVELDLSGMLDRQKANFDKVDARMGGPYDYLSIMHYAERAFSPHNPATPTIRCKTDGQIVPCPADMGQRRGLSSGDVAGLDAIYSEISRFPSQGWDASITRPVPLVGLVAFNGAFQWPRSVGIPKQPNAVGGRVDYLGLQILAPREMTITWRQGTKSVSYSNWRDPVQVAFQPVRLGAAGGVLPFRANVPATLPLILDAEAFPRRWSPPPKPVACALRVATCSAYQLWFDAGPTGNVPDPASAAPYLINVAGAWRANTPASPLERESRQLSLDAVQRVADKPLWAMKPIEGVYRINAAPR